MTRAKAKDYLETEWLIPVVNSIKAGDAVAIVECFDPLRLSQLLTLKITEVKGGERRPVYGAIYYFNLATNEFLRREVEGETWTRLDLSAFASGDVYGAGALGFNPLEKVRELLHNQRTLVFLHLPLVKERAMVDPERVNNFVYSVLRDGEVQRNGSFLIIITPSLEAYFASNLLENLIIAREEPASEKERAGLINVWLNILKSGGKIPSSIDPKAFIEETAGLYPYQVKTVVRYVAISDTNDYRKAVREERKKIFARAYGIDLIIPEVNFDLVGGYQYAKEYVRKFIRRLQFKDVLEKHGIGYPKGLLLFGPPGTGKTYFVHAIAGELGYPIVQVDFASFASKWYGETEQRVKNLLKVIDSISPVVVMLDEIEQIAVPRAQTSTHEVTVRVVSLFNSWLSDPRRKAFVVATSNYPEKLDPAFIRAGRFDGRLPFLYPDEQARRDIFEIHIKLKRKLKLNGSLDEIVKLTNFYSGAEIETLVERGVDNALVRFNGKGRIVLTESDLIEALDEVRVDIVNRKKLIKAYLSIAREFGTDRRVLESVERQLGSIVSFE